MKEKHSKISRLVLAITMVLLFGFSMLSTSQAFAAQAYRGNGHQKEWRTPKKQNTLGHRDYNRRPDYHRYAGYRAHPYDTHRHYAYYEYKGHHYAYRGHWRSWDQWDRYVRLHPEIRRHGTYYRENSSLMFRFFEPDTGEYFFFSIGG